ncbi:hypothetical protein [Azospirillum soli]|uniref:hypothetical protein n=1 Tax=Azospirillum soli TaxID=1304799 RepID=UPI001AEA8470|nr:hypothetical protein [Azospirillum soli]MBP2311488.1 hypothetical protein [Azospirillum soli]
MLDSYSPEPFSLGAFRELVHHPGAPVLCGCIDVPIQAVVALGRADKLLGNRDTWRTIVNKGVHGRGWTHGVFDYFDGDIMDKDFPADGATGMLKLSCIGGAVTCANGNHRLAGAVAWIASTRPHDSVLRKVWVDATPVRRNLVASILELRSRGAKFACAHGFVEGRHEYVLRVTRWGIARTYCIRGGVLERCYDWRERSARWRRPLDHEGSWHWWAIPDSVLNAWSNSSWLDRQAASLSERKYA